MQLHHFGDYLEINWSGIDTSSSLSFETGGLIRQRGASAFFARVEVASSSLILSLVKGSMLDGSLENNFQMRKPNPKLRSTIEKFFKINKTIQKNRQSINLWETCMAIRHSEVRVWLGLTVGWGCQKRNQWSIFLVLAANTVRIMDVLPAGAKVMSAMMYPFPNK